MEATPPERRLAAILGGADAKAMLEDDEVMGLLDFGVAQACFAAGRYEEAVRWARLSLRRSPDWSVPHVLHAASCAQLDRLDDAAAALERLRSAVPGFDVQRARLLFAGSEPDFLERLASGLRRAGSGP